MSRYLDLLKNYAKFIGLEPVEDLLANQELLIGEIVVGLAPDDNENPYNLTFFTSLGKPAASVPKEKLFQLMLEANAFWIGTAGCTLGLQNQSGEVILCGRAPLNVTTAQTLSAVLNGFADLALVWREVVEGRVSPELPQIAV